MSAKAKGMRIFRLLAVAFVAVFVLRWAYEIFFTANDVVVQLSNTAAVYGVEPKSNIATDRVTQSTAAGQVTLDQKYDKTATLSAVTDAFEETYEALRTAIEEHSAVIQTENLSGLSGAQTLRLSIGVVPDRFDEMVEALKSLATLRSFTVQKTDKTDAYRALVAEIETLQKTLSSYQALKQTGGSIQDLLLLEEKILEMETALQTLRVDAGLFATENSFCTVNLTLAETAVSTISLRFVLSCALESFLWTMAAFAVALLVLLGLFAAAYALAALRQRIQSPAKDPRQRANEAPEKAEDEPAEHP